MREKETKEKLNKNKGTRKMAEMDLIKNFCCFFLCDKNYYFSRLIIWKQSTQIEIDVSMYNVNTGQECGSFYCKKNVL